MTNITAGLEQESHYEGMTRLVACPHCGRGIPLKSMICGFCGSGLPAALEELEELRAAVKRYEALIRRLQRVVVRP